MPATQKTERHPIHAFVSPQAHENWHAFAIDEGVSVSALIEALAGILPLTSPGCVEEPATILRKVRKLVPKARRIDAERRAR